MFDELTKGKRHSKMRDEGKREKRKELYKIRVVHHKSME